MPRCHLMSPVVNDERVARGAKVQRDRASHSAQSNETDIHRISKPDGEGKCLGGRGAGPRLRSIDDACLGHSGADIDVLWSGSTRDSDVYLVGR